MPDTDDVIWLTYDALSARLGITPESCRNLVRRRRWARQDGNDGARRIGVPHDYLEERDDSSTCGPADGAIESPTSVPTDAPVDGGMVMALAALERHIGRLEGDLAQARGQIGVLTLERDEARAAVRQVELLCVQLDAERARASAVELDRDRWHDEARQDRAARIAEAEKAQAEADDVRAELKAWRARPWWRRALG